jgi:cytochrome c biogenesis protein CcmG, thiol:disulfide interchange protein DsbE
MTGDEKRRERNSGIALVVLLAVAFAVVGGRIWAIATGPLPPGPGKEAPAFTAPDLDGSARSLADLRGSVVLVDFWATWCPPCVAAMPGLDRLNREYASRGFSVLGVNIEPGDEAQVRSFLTQRNLRIQVVVDPGDVVRRYGVFSYPTSFLIGRDGVIRRVFRGPADEATLRAAIVSALEEGAPRSAS